MNAATKWIAILTLTNAVACVGNDPADPADPGSWVLEDPDERPDEVTKDTNDDPVDDPVDDPNPIEDPVVMPAEPAIVCVSEFVGHDGAHYRMRLAGAGAETTVEVERNTLPTGLDMEQLSEPTSEVVIEESAVSASLGDFHGVELGDFFVVVDQEIRDGFWKGFMRSLNPHQDTPVSENGTVAATCWREGLEMPARYVDGRCIDGNGQPAENIVDFRYVRSTGNGQCATLAEERLNGEAYGYPVFEGVDLRGADLTRAQLHFASLSEARLEGAHMEDFSFGYAIVTGSIDEHTVLPESFCVGGEDPAADGRFECMQ